MIEKVMREVPIDYVVRAPALGFDSTDNPVEPIAAIVEGNRHGVARNAFTQLLSRASIPAAYASTLSETAWGRDLLAHNLREVYGHDAARYLARTYDGRVRGFLSNRYRRIDSRLCVEAVAESCQEIGLVPIRGDVSETKVSLKALLPCVFEPYQNEVLAYGLTWENSDYGNGKHRLSVFVLRCWCTNYAMGDEVLGEIHLGKRLDERIEYSQRTYELDTDASVSALRDTIRHVLSPETVAHMNGIVAAAANETLSHGALKARLDGFKKLLSKDEIAAVTEAYNSADIEMLPPGNTTWRLSNALSWVAGKADDAERRIELEKLAARPLPQLLPAAA